jgi:hypothetical protein
VGLMVSSKISVPSSGLVVMTMVASMRVALASCRAPFAKLTYRLSDVVVVAIL